MEIGVSLQGIDETGREIVDATMAILKAMYGKDVERYADLVSTDVSSIESYIAPYRIDGLGFHLNLIASGGNASPTRLDLLNPRVQVYGTSAVFSYTLLKTFPTDGHARFETINESRVFVRMDRTWKMVHLHKSPAA